MFKIESYFGPLLMSYLNKYVKLEEESFKLSLWGGDATFHNLELRYDVLEDLVPLPIGLKSGQVHELSVHVPWTKLGSESVVITLNTVECIFALKTDFVHRSKKEKEEFPSKSQKPPKLERNIPPGYLKSYLVNIINNIHVKVNNLIIKFVEDDIVLSMNAKSLEYLPATTTWSRGFIDFSGGNLLVHKLVQISDLTVCLDQMDANGHIELYQEPILYRCSVECRFVLSYHSFSSNKPEFLKFNIRLGDLELNISTSQMPLFRRLIELFYAIYYNTINWDAIVGCGFSNKIVTSVEKPKESQPEVVFESEITNSEEDQSTWGSWAWSYVPSLFVYEEDLLDEDLSDNDKKYEISNKRTLIFGIFLDSLQINLKKSQAVKIPYTNQRLSRFQKTILFMKVKGYNIGLNVSSKGLGFFNVQLGCTNIDVVNSGEICPCGQLYKLESNHKNSSAIIGNETVASIGSPILNEESINDQYLTNSLFSESNNDKDYVMSSLLKLNSVCSQESYATLFSQEHCKKYFNAVWFDYIYCMQIIKNDLNESQIDLSNLCNTDGIRESSIINLYIGQSIININSHFAHNLVEITKALDISKYSTYFKKSSYDDCRDSIFFPTEDQVARIHEFVPIRRLNICLIQSTININPFLESHNNTKVCPIIEIKAKLIKYSKSAPMYPKHLIDCVSVLSSNLLKESKDLLNKCYLLKILEISGLSMSLLFPESMLEKPENIQFLKSEIISSCNLEVMFNSLLYSDSWKTSSFINDEKSIKLSSLRFKMIPSHVKTMYVIAASNYSWLSNYLGLYILSTKPDHTNQGLDDITLKFMDPQHNLIKGCYEKEYKDKTYELHIVLPDIFFKSWRTVSSYFIDAKIAHETLFVYLKETSSPNILPVLDNKYDQTSNNSISSPPFCLLYCQIPTQSKHINCTFSFHCEVGSINFMFSSQLINWFTFPVLDFDLNDNIVSQSYIPSIRSRESTVINNPRVVSSTRSTADGTSRPESPTVLSNIFPFPGHPKSITILDPSMSVKKEKSVFCERNYGWWNMFKNACSKYFFFLQSLDVCIKVRKSKLFIMTITDPSAFQSSIHSCNQWVEEFSENNKSSIFLITLTRLALINSQRKEYLEDNYERSGPQFHQAKSSIFIESFPWELIFHDIQVDCIHCQEPREPKSHILYDSILKPVSINCTLSATPKCSSPERLDTFYSISWGIHVDITEVQPTLKQIYLIKLLDFFVNIVLKVSCKEFTKQHLALFTGHYYAAQNIKSKMSSYETSILKSKQSISTHSTKKSPSIVSTLERKTFSPNYRVTSSKVESQTDKGINVGFKLSFWIQCTLSQFQLIILLNDEDDFELKDKKVCVVMQIDDVTGSIDVQEKFVEIKSKFGSIMCELGFIKDDKIICDTPILKSGSKFLSTTSISNKMKEEYEADVHLDNVNRHCFSIAVVRTTVNNLSQRPLSTYHQFKETESFKSYPTEFTGNFSIPPDSIRSNQSFVTQISSIVEPFELVISSYFIDQCHILTDKLLSIYLQFFYFSGSNVNSTNKINMSSLKLEPYFISEDMPKFHLLIKSSKIIMPCGINQGDSKDNKDDGNDCIILSWNKISLQPFSDNPILRPEMNTECIGEEDSTKSRSTVDNIELDLIADNSLDDNRQFQLDIINCGLFSSKYSLCSNQKISDITLPKVARFSDSFVTSVFHGQNPAFEWNYYSKMSTSFNSKRPSADQMKPILNPIDVQIIFAGTLYQKSDCFLKKQLYGGYGLEINILSSIEFLIDNSTLNNINTVVKNFVRLFSSDNYQFSKNPAIIYDNINSHNAIHSLEDWMKCQGLGNIIPCVPINILITTRKILFLQGLESKVHGLSLTISQPHLLISFKNERENKLELSLFDLTTSISPIVWSESCNFFDYNCPQNYWTNNQSFILAEMRNVVRTKCGSHDIKTGVPKSFLTVRFSNFYLSNGRNELNVNFSRQLIVETDAADIQEVVNVLNCLLDWSKYSVKEVKESVTPEIFFPMHILIPQYFILSMELISLVGSDHETCESDLGCKLGNVNIKVYTLKKQKFNNLQSSAEFCCDTLTVLSSRSQNGLFNNILGPLKINGKCLFNKYRMESKDVYWTSSEIIGELKMGSVNLTIDKRDIVLVNSLITTLNQSLQPLISNNEIICELDESTCDLHIEMFHDDLRSEKFQIITEINIDTNANESDFNAGLSIVANDGTVAFSNDGEDLAAMYWTYPEARFITSIEVKPVPFVFIEYKLTKEDNYEELQVPCQLEYWSYLSNSYQIYKEFHLSENQVEKIEDFPTLEQLPEIVASKSWRVVFDCYARYLKKNDSKKASYSEKAMLVYLSPLVLAASMKVDSCYAPSVVRNSCFSMSALQFQLKYSDFEQELIESKSSCMPFNATHGPYDNQCIVDQSTLFTVTCSECCFQFLPIREIHFDISKIVLYTVNPFIAIKSPTLLVKNINMTLVNNPYESNNTQFNFNVGIVQAEVDQCNLRQCTMISSSLTELICTLKNDKTESKKLNLCKFWFCNFLDRRIQLRQYQTSFYKICDVSKSGGIAPGEAVMLKFLPVNYNKYQNFKTESTVQLDSIKLTLGLCSELKGTVRWTEPIEIPNLNYDEVMPFTADLRTWGIDSTNNIDSTICSNSSNLSNSYNAKSLVLLHCQSIQGLNKLILMGNTIFNNLTSDCISINFSLPTELSSGFSFNSFPSTSSERATSIHINWKVISLTAAKSTFELSFRSGSEDSEYRSLSYSMSVPKFETLSKCSYYHQSIIKLKEYKLSNQVMTLNGQSKQVLCTMEWFYIDKEENIFLMMTLSPLVVCKNMMLHNVRLQLTWTSSDDDKCKSHKESTEIVGQGGSFVLTNFFPNSAICVNASFLNDSKLLFDKPLVLTESGLLESLGKNLQQIYKIETHDNDHDTIRKKLANRLCNIIDKKRLELCSESCINPYTVLITIKPWMLMTNRTKINLVLGFEKNIYLLESLSDFVPPLYEKPIKIGVTFDNEIFWSKSFVIGNSILKQSEIEMCDLSWNIVDTELGTEAYIQINIILPKEGSMVPVTLKHIFANQTITQSSDMHVTPQINHLTIEYSVHIRSQTKINLNILPVSCATEILQECDLSVKSLLLVSNSQYVPLESFFYAGYKHEEKGDGNWFICVTNSVNGPLRTSFCNFASIINISKYSKFREGENITHTGFTFMENVEKGRDFSVLIVNSTLDYRTNKVFVDIFECKSVPIKITNQSGKRIFVNEYEESGNIFTMHIEPLKSIPLWPYNFRSDFNKDGYARFNNFRIRLGIYINEEIEWTDFFPINPSDELFSMNLMTKLSSFNIFLHIESTSDAKIHVIVNDCKVSLNPRTIIASPQLSVNISISNIIISILEVCKNLELSEETISLNLEGFNALYSNNIVTKSKLCDISISNIQLDNKRYNSGMYDFPVVLYSRNIDLQKFFHCIVETDCCDMVKIDLKFEQEIEVFIENIFLYDMLRVYAKLVQCLSSTSDTSVTFYSSKPLNFGAVNISSIPLIITVHAFLKLYVSCEATSLSLPKFFFQPSLAKLKSFQKNLYEHYVTAALIRCGWVMGSFELLGNPSGIVQHLSTGLSNLLCSKNIDHGLLADFLLRILSFCRYTTGGLVSSFTGIASSVSRNLDYLCLDNNHITRQDSFRRQYQPNGIIHGFYQGLSGFALSMLGAIAGLADHPLQASQEALGNHSSVTIALLKGLSKGIIGVVTKPLSGTAELFAQTGRGLLRTTGISILRCHFYSERLNITLKSELLINEEHILIHFLNQRSENVLVDQAMCLWSGIATNSLQQSVLLFVSNSSMIEWNIDNPLRDKHKIYNLFEYEIIQSSTSPSSSEIKLQRIKLMDKERISSECRINAFLSDQVCDTVNAPYLFDTDLQNNSYRSSFDSTEFINIVDHKPDREQHNIEDDTLVEEPFVFLFDYPSDSIWDVVTYIKLYR